jgi:hypothetical protein
MGVLMGSDSCTDCAVGVFNIATNKAAQIMNVLQLQKLPPITY